ncbi:hypothetical protein [Streptomyces fuscigenes]|uniref:hypothetical protein n=1 Tax=Streptomyces fuscigenes TaxID=1528880 RepID=UPI001F41A7A7|nr:hypothetical protein [Streptomyces fuscigenes]MCF3960250.1 hypothetical protein [Streptomyces fuscigenes]
MAGCDFGFVAPTVGGYCVGDGRGTAPTDLGNSGFDAIAESAAQAASTTVKALGGAWMNLGGADLSAAGGPVAFLRGSTLWLTTFTAVLCLLVAAGHLAWQRRSEPARQALQGLLGLVVASSAGVAVVNLLTVAGDRFGVWIIDRSTGCRQISPAGEPVAECVAEFDKRTSAMLALGGTDSSFLVLFMALLVVVASVAQIALVVTRTAMLVILTGTLPLTAAAGTTPTGRILFRRSLGWLFAFILYKPAAAVVYAAAFAMAGRQRDDNQVVSMVSGVVLIVLSCFTLPALLRFAAPVMQAAVSGARRAAGSAQGRGEAAPVTGALPVPHLRGLAAGRSVSGAALGPVRTTGGARHAPVAARSHTAADGAARAPGTDSGRDTPEGGSRAGRPEPTHEQAGTATESARPGAGGSPAGDHHADDHQTGDPAAPRPHTDDQEEPRVRH